VADLHHRHFRQPELTGRREASVAGKDRALFIRDDRHDKAEFIYAGGNLRHLAFRMLTRIARCRGQRGRVHIRDLNWRNKLLNFSVRRSRITALGGLAAEWL